MVLQVSGAVQRKSSSTKQRRPTPRWHFVPGNAERLCAGVRTRLQDRTGLARLERRKEVRLPRRRFDPFLGDESSTKPGHTGVGLGGTFPWDGNA
jgi:hypothetical protein